MDECTFPVLIGAYGGNLLYMGVKRASVQESVGKSFMGILHGLNVHMGSDTMLSLPFVRICIHDRVCGL